MDTLIVFADKMTIYYPWTGILPKAADRKATSSLISEMQLKFGGGFQAE